jgi:hypothetical protein
MGIDTAARIAERRAAAYFRACGVGWGDAETRA